MKNLPLVLLVCAVTFLSLTSCLKNCGEEALPEPDYNIGDTVSVAFQQSAQFTPSFQIKFDSVVSDSRCPCNAECVWAGEVTVLLKITLDGEVHSEKLSIGMDPNTVVVGSYKIALVDVLPYPCDVQIEPTVKIVVTQN